MVDAGTTMLVGTPAVTGLREVNCETVCNHCENIKRELEKTLLELRSEKKNNNIAGTIT
jgi:hypothetical protein